MIIIILLLINDNNNYYLYTLGRYCVLMYADYPWMLASCGWLSAFFSLPIGNECIVLLHDHSHPQDHCRWN